jgi:hypothetical protein
VHVDVRLDAVVLRALEKAPERRYQQAVDLKTAVEGVRDGVGANREAPADREAGEDDPTMRAADPALAPPPAHERSYFYRLSAAAWIACIATTAAPIPLPWNVIVFGGGAWLATQAHRRATNARLRFEFFRLFAVEAVLRFLPILFLLFVGAGLAGTTRFGPARGFELLADGHVWYLLLPQVGMGLLAQVPAWWRRGERGDDPRFAADAARARVVDIGIALAWAATAAVVLLACGHFLSRTASVDALGPPARDAWATPLGSVCAMLAILGPMSSALAAFARRPLQLLFAAAISFAAAAGFVALAFDLAPLRSRTLAPGDGLLLSAVLSLALALGALARFAVPPRRSSSSSSSGAAAAAA